MSRTLFIHIPRTAGTSVFESGIAASTRNMGLKQNIVKYMEMDNRAATTINQRFAGIVQKHIPYSYLDRSYINRFDRVCAIVRNPWERLVSLYNHADSINLEGTWYHINKISWDEFLGRMDKFVMTPSYYWAHPYNQWGTQLDWVDPKKVDILRFSHLQEDLNSYFNKEVNLPKVNQSSPTDYRTYYTSEQIEKVAKWYRLDIEHWGFDFETGATKNYWSKI